MTGVRRLDCNAPGGAYPVWIGQGILAGAGELIPAGRAELAALVTDANVRGLHGAKVRAGLEDAGFRVEEFTIEPGERSKDVATLEAIWRWLAGIDAHRGDLLVALGGGVVGDVGGFAAATYHRGIRLVQAPTTLLGQVDASIGGKTAIDLPEGKNLVGAFHQPSAVLADIDALSTLPDAAFATGMAEVIKHGLIARGELLGRLGLERDRILRREPDTLGWLVAEAAAVKVWVVEQDEREEALRAHLNYGHTLGHALEVVGHYTQVTHGEAVAIGMMFAAHLAAALGHADLVREHREALDAFGLPTRGATAGFDDVAKAWQRDKKYDAGVRFVLLRDLGDPVVTGGIPLDALRAAYEEVR